MRASLAGLLAAMLASSACTRTSTAERTDNPTGTAGRADTVSAAPVRNHEGPATAARAAAASATEPAARDITIPAGTSMRVVLDTAVSSDTSRAEDRVTAHLARPIVVHGETALAAGSRIGGVVTAATRSGKVKGRAHVALAFESVSPAGEDQRYAIRTTALGRTAAATKQKDALEIGAPAAGGALIGALVGGKKGALVGTAVGGGAGTAVVLSTRGKEVHLRKGTALTLKLAAPLTVRVRA